MEQEGNHEKCTHEFLTGVVGNPQLKRGLKPKNCSLICEYQRNGLIYMQDGNHRYETLKMGVIFYRWVIVWFKN